MNSPCVLRGQNHPSSLGLLRFSGPTLESWDANVPGFPSIHAVWGPSALSTRPQGLGVGGDARPLLAMHWAAGRDRVHSGNPD
jgi:hypothetical protein